MTDIALALDVGGTKVAVARVADDGTVLGKEHAPTSWASIESLVERVRRGDESVCGIGSAGPMTEAGERVSPVNLPEWRDFPLRAKVEDLTGVPTFLDGDAKALALAEGRFGAAQGVDDYIAMVVSTGVGGGIVLGGELLDGNAGNAGHIGHVIVEPAGRVCGCGARGCLEAQASGTAIEATTGAPPADAPDEVRAAAGRWVGIGIASVANLLSLQLAVVAGSVALGYGDVFFDAAQRALDEHARLWPARVVPSTLADAPIIGAACVAFTRARGR